MKAPSGDITLNCRGVLSLIKQWQGVRQPAIVVPEGCELSFSDLLVKAEHVSNAVKESGILPHQCLAMPLGSTPDAVAVFLGVMSYCGCAPINPKLPARELEAMLKNLNVSGIVMYSSDMHFPEASTKNIEIRTIDVESALRRAATSEVESKLSYEDSSSHKEQLLPSARAILLSTSGTTARPKIVALTHKMVATSVFNVCQSLTLSDKDRYLSVMPLFHIHGLMTLLGALAAGNTVILPERFIATDFLSLLEDYNPTWYSSAPTIHQGILSAISDRSEVGNHKLRFVRSASSPLPIATYKELERRLGVLVIEFYGMTEAADMICTSSQLPAERNPGSVGKPVSDLALKIQGESHAEGKSSIGQILIRGETVIRAYESNDSTHTSFDNGWFCTGDLGYVDKSGNLFLVGRVKEVINRGGDKISPVEVDNVLMSHSSILQAVTFPAAHPTLGEVVAAAVVLKEDAQKITPQSIREYCKDHLSSYKVPTKIVIVEQIPTTASGKPQRFELSNYFGGFEEKPLHVAPETEEEKLLCQIIQSVLNLSQVGIKDDYFDLGGDSMTAVVVIEELNNAGFNIDTEQFFKDATIEALAGSISLSNHKVL